MRVDQIIAINAHQQPNQKTDQNIKTTSVKSISGMTFEDYLRANLQQLSTPKITGQTENQVAGLIMGYYTQLKIAQKSESKPESSAS